MSNITVNIPNEFDEIFSINEIKNETSKDSYSEPNSDCSTSSESSHTSTSTTLSDLWLKDEIPPRTITFEESIASNLLNPDSIDVSQYCQDFNNMFNNSIKVQPSVFPTSYTETLHKDIDSNLSDVNIDVFLYND